MANPVSHSNFPSGMNFQDLLDMSSNVPEECAAALPKTDAQGTLPSSAEEPCSAPQKLIKFDEPLTNKIASLYDTHALSDVTFVVGPEEERMELRAHKMVLALASPVFTAMFYGELATTQRSESGRHLNHAVSVVEVPDCTPRSFKMMLEYIYKGEEPTLTVDDALSLLYTSRKYAVRGLEDKCCVLLSSSMTSENVFDILYAATFYNLTALDFQCWEYMEENPVEVLLSHLEFLTHETMQAVLKNERLNADEVDLFKVLLRWAELLCEKKDLPPTTENLRLVSSAELRLIRFPIMSGPEFAEVVVPTGLLSVDQIAKVFTVINSSEEKRQSLGCDFCEFSGKRRSPRPPTAKEPVTPSTPAVFTFVAADRQREDDQNGHRGIVATTAGGNVDNVIALLGIDGVTVTVNQVNPVELPLPNGVPSVISENGERNRSRQRQRRNRRRVNNNDTTPTQR